MIHRTLRLLALCAAWTVGSAHAQPTCTKPEFIDEIVRRIDGTHCDKAVDQRLEEITKQVGDAKDKARAGEQGAQLSDAYLKALHDLREAYWDNQGWRAGLVRGIDAAVARARANKLPLNAFSDVRGITLNEDPEECAFVVGRRDGEDYACFVLEGSQLPAPPANRSTLLVHVLSVDEARRAVFVLQTAHSAIDGLKLPDIQAAIVRLQEAQKRFDNLRRYGYLQYPWELWIDSALTSQARREECQVTGTLCSGEAGLDPARIRAIFMHPGVGLSFPGFGASGKPSANSAIALSLEAAGAVFYSEDFDWYLGASLGAIVNDGDFRDPRLGAFVHVTRWVHAGYLMSFFREETELDASLFLSMDLGTAFGASFLE